MPLSSLCEVNDAASDEARHSDEDMSAFRSGSPSVDVENPNICTETDPENEVDSNDDEDFMPCLGLAKEPPSNGRHRRQWACSACSYLNPNPLHLACVICGTPRKESDLECIETSSDDMDAPADLSDGLPATKNGLDGVRDSTDAKEKPEVLENDESPRPVEQFILSGSATKKSFTTHQEHLSQETGRCSHALTVETHSSREHDPSCSSPNQVTLNVRPRLRSMLPHRSIEPPRDATPPILEATLVHEDPPAPLYDAVPVEDPTWWKRYRKIVFAALLSLTFGILAGAISILVAVGNRGNESSMTTSSTIAPFQVNTTTSPTSSSIASTTTTPSDTTSTQDETTTAPTETTTTTTTGSTTTEQTRDWSFLFTTTTKPYTVLDDSRTWVQFGQTIHGEAIGDQSGKALALSADGKVLAIGAHRYDGAGSDSGHVRILEWSKDERRSWIPLGEDIDGESAGDQSGHSLDLSADGRTIAIGSPNNIDSGMDSGSVRVYQMRNNTAGLSWYQLGKDVDGDSYGDVSGSDVALSSDGTTLAVGATGYIDSADKAGYVRVFKYHTRRQLLAQSSRSATSSWNQIGEDIPGKALGDNFGYSVSLSANGTKLAVGAIGNDGRGVDSGHVRVYHLVEQTWRQMGQEIGGERAHSYAGVAVDLSADGNILAVGSHTGQGRVKVYKWDGASIWRQLGQTIQGVDDMDMCGFVLSLSADGKTLAIGCPENGAGGEGSGHVIAYRLDDEGGTSWTQVGQIIHGEEKWDVSGHSVALSQDGCTLAIGAIGHYRKMDTIDKPGSVRVFGQCLRHIHGRIVLLWRSLAVESKIRIQHVDFHLH